MQSKFNRQEAENALRTITHPESGKNLVDGGFLLSLEATELLSDTQSAAQSTAKTDKRTEAPSDASRVSHPEMKIEVVLRFHKRRDPFASSLARKVKSTLEALYTHAEVEVRVEQSGDTAAKEKTTGESDNKSALPEGVRIIAVASGKGGVGKSTVTSNLAVALSDEGYRVGILDADIYGPSQPSIFGCEDYAPEVENRDGTDYMIPAEAWGVKLMSIGFFVGRSDALLWRGPMATSALRQLLHQTLWGELDYLLIDLPPGTGDIHLSLISELSIDGAVIVSTPQRLSVADVVRGVEMLRNDKVGVPIIGIVENMSWFTPAELPESRYYIFGNGGARRLAEACSVDFLGEIPITASMGEASEQGVPAVVKYPFTREYYRQTVLKIVEKCPKKVDKMTIKF